MKNIAKWVLGVAVVAGGLGLGATKAQAAEVGFHERARVGYVAPRPGYRWNGGYHAGYVAPERWAFGGVRAVGPAPYRFDGRRGFYRRDYRDHDRFRR
jgi:hypothetical protein